MLTETPASIVTDQLRSGEKILWYGKPNPLRRARSQLSPVLFGAVWTVFVLFMYNVAEQNFVNSRSNFFGSNNFSSFETIFKLVLVVFIGVGLWMISTPLRNYLKALNTYYAVTDQHAIIISKLFSTTMIFYTKRDIRSIRRVEYGDGTGDVIFGWDQHTYTDYNTSDPNRMNNSINLNLNDGHVSVNTGPQQRTVTVAIGFFGIPDAQAVETLMVKTFGDEEKRLM